MAGTRTTRSRAKFEDKWNLNNRNPVSRLPPEVLLLIFGFLRLRQEKEKKKKAARLTEGSTSLYSDNESAGRIGWVAVGQVCRRWRETALGSPQLWSRIEVEDNKCRWALEMLKRSKETLLSIHLDLYLMDKRCRYKQTRTALARSALSHVQKHLARCKSLTILPGDCGYTKLDSVLEGYPMPNLETLVIDGEKSIQPHIELSDKELVASSLRVLKLSHVALDFDAIFLRGLVSLQLRFSQPTTSFLRFLDCLASMPLLKELDVHPFAFNLDRSEVPLVRAHPLKSRPLDLTDLTICSSSALLETAALLSVVAKKSIHLNIHVLAIVEDTSLDLESFWNAVSDHLSEAGRSFGLCTLGMSHGIFSFQGLRGKKTTIHGTQKDSAAFSVHLSFWDDDTRASSLVQSAYQHLPINYLIGAHVYSDVPIDLAPTFGKIQTLEYLSLDGSVVPGFFETLCNEATFPALDDIAVTVPKLFFHHFKSGPIIRALRSRHERNTPIDVLSLKGVSVMSTAIKKALQAVVGSLEVEYKK